MLPWCAWCALFLGQPRKVTWPAPLANTTVRICSTVSAHGAALAFALTGAATAGKKLAISAASIECACLAIRLARFVLKVPRSAERTLYSALLTCEGASEAVRTAVLTSALLVLARSTIFTASWISMATIDVLLALFTLVVALLA